MELESKAVYINSKQTTQFPFKLIPLESNILSYISLLFLYALLEGFFWDVPHLCLCSPLEWGPMMISLRLGKSDTEQDQVERVVVPV